LNYLNPSLLSLALALLLLGCGSESDKPPLVPDIVSISIQDFQDVTYLRSVGHDVQLYGDILYTDGSSSSTADELDWESNDSTIISINNGTLTANANHGKVLISFPGESPGPLPAPHTMVDEGTASPTGEVRDKSIPGKRVSEGRGYGARARGA